MCGCGSVARITGRDLCNACFQKDPTWPFRYAERLTGRLDETPDGSTTTSTTWPSVTRRRERFITSDGSATRSQWRNQPGPTSSRPRWRSTRSRSTNSSLMPGSASPMTRNQSELSNAAGRDSARSQRASRMRLQGSVKRWSDVKTEHTVSVYAATPTAPSKLASLRSGISHASHRMLPRRWIESNSSPSQRLSAFWRAAHAETPHASSPIYASSSRGVDDTSSP